MLHSTQMRSLQMVDLRGQHQRIAHEIDEAIQAVVSSASFINGPVVKQFTDALSEYVGAKYVIPCGNGTDALQIAMMGLGLKPGDEVIVPAYTYVATAEVIALLGLKPVFIDVDPYTFNMQTQDIEKKISSKTAAIVPVHLFGQCAAMEEIMEIAEQFQLHVIEDAAQSLGAAYMFKDGSIRKAGTIGSAGITSFFPSKNLGGYGDGGAIFTDDTDLAARLKSIGNHGQTEKYIHEVVGVNSRLDSLQAAILNVKLKYLDSFCEQRKEAAQLYDQLLGEVNEIAIPKRVSYSTHVFNQYTIKVPMGKRDALRAHLKEKGIPSMLYYPMPLHLQKAYSCYGYEKCDFPVAEVLAGEVLSLPMHTELDEDQLIYISEQIKQFFYE